MADPLSAAGRGERAVSFGPFRLLPAQRLLLEGESPVRIGSRALDILIALVENPGEVVSKDELLARAWPQTFVDESNLKFQISALRRTLGDGSGQGRYLATIPGRGYSFIAPLRLTDALRSATPQLVAPSRPNNLPALLTRLIGRGETVERLIGQLARHRLLTIVGTGGIGKTSIALAVAEGKLATFKDGTWLIDFAPVADPGLVSSALATVLGLEIRSDDPLPSLTARLRDREMLLVLDNCEHVVTAAADLAARVLKEAPGIRILATSRESLRVEGERIFRLTPLACPPASDRITAAEALAYPAVQLFVERAVANLGEFELSDADAPRAGDICRQLDGIPLAIELAAARVEVLGVGGLLARLNERLRLLTSGRRTAVARHQTLIATLDWSYQLLAETEKRTLSRLAIFAGGFKLQAAGVIATDATYSESEIIGEMSELVSKSLVVADVDTAEPRFRLFDTTRAYALSKLVESGEFDAVGRRHAEYYRALLEAAARDKAPSGDWLAPYAADIDNIRAALTWAFGTGGEASIGVGLAVGSAPIWLEMSLLSECHAWMEKAVECLGAADRGTRHEMVLQCALGISLMFTEGMSSKARMALTRANMLAAGVQDSDYQLRALVCLATFSHRLEEFRDALALGRQAGTTAKEATGPVAISTADCMLSCSLFFLGAYSEALVHAQRAQRTATSAVRRAHVERTGLDHSIWARCAAAQILWVQGLPDQSARATLDLLVDAQAGGHPLSLCLALTWCVCPISLRLGDLETAKNSIAQLKDYAQKFASNYYAPSLGFEGEFFAKQGDVVAGEQQLRKCLEGLRRAQYEVLYTPFLSALAEILAIAGRLDDSLAIADEAVQRTQRNDGFWWMPEALRIKGHILLLSDEGETATAEDHFRRSLDMAHQQGALSWELRSAMSLARLHRDKNHLSEALALLSSVHCRFTEGFESADLIEAQSLIRDLLLTRTNRG